MIGSDDIPEHIAERMREVDRQRVAERDRRRADYAQEIADHDRAMRPLDIATLVILVAYGALALAGAWWLIGWITSS